MKVAAASRVITNELAVRAMEENSYAAITSTIAKNRRNSFDGRKRKRSTMRGPKTRAERSLFLRSPTQISFRLPNLLFLTVKSFKAFRYASPLKSGHSVSVTYISVYAICQRRKLLNLISPLVLMRRSGSGMPAVYR